MKNKEELKDHFRQLKNKKEFDKQWKANQLKRQIMAYNYINGKGAFENDWNTNLHKFFSCPEEIDLYDEDELEAIEELIGEEAG